ncbi:MAG: Prophage regulatory protein (AlpA) [Ramlibacter sp.]|jgi:predicted DNA-binding transcriptional regulator AlpA|nr:Prophage regulatory protein (AlpA) [Ramlibacter sp.]
MHEAVTLGPQLAAAAPKKNQALPTLLNEGQVAELLGVSRRTVHALRQQDWFPPAIEFGPRALRWHREELLSAIVARAPRVTKQEEPAQLVEARAERRVFQSSKAGVRKW